MNSVLLYDTTLRDGTQRENLSLSVNDKLKIAVELDSFGFHYIEGGWPGSNPKDAEFFERVRELSLDKAKICAFGSTRRKGISCEDDSNLAALVAAETPVVTLVGKSWNLHVREVLRTTFEENLAMIADSVRFLKDLGKEVVFDAEHFFDGFKDDPGYALAVVGAAEEAGADHIVLCDTNGGSMPWEVDRVVRESRQRLDGVLGVHAHNDSGCAVANTLAALRAGCVMVQGTINGYGERVGNANLSTVVPDLQLKLGTRCVSDHQLQGWTRLSAFVAERANLEVEAHQPYVGRSAFTHKGGIHVAAVLQNRSSYEHIDPAVVGNSNRSVVSELAGRGNAFHFAGRRGLEVDSDRAARVVAEVKELESCGFSFEGADASVELMLRRLEDGYQPPFQLEDFMVVVERRQGRGLVAEATVKVNVMGEVKHTVSGGEGPVDALGRALRMALKGHYPLVSDVKLTDYKVRIIDSESGTAATTRVLVDFQLGSRRWATVGAGTNIIEASWIALSSSFEFALVSGFGNDEDGGDSEHLKTALGKNMVDRAQTPVHNPAP